LFRTFGPSCRPVDFDARERSSRATDGPRGAVGVVGGQIVPHGTGGPRGGPPGLVLAFGEGEGINGNELRTESTAIHCNSQRKKEAKKEKQRPTTASSLRRNNANGKENGLENYNGPSTSFRLIL